MGNVVAASVTRASLGLPDLDLNDFTHYYVADTFLGGQVTWNRTQVSSPWVDGQITVARTRGTVTETVAVEVLGASPNQVQTNLVNLLEAFLQDTYQLHVTLGGGSASATYVYQCEAADYQVSWTGPRMQANQVQVQLSVPRSPVPVTGGV